MVGRPVNSNDQTYEREPYDWYCDGPRPIDQLFDGLDMGPPAESFVYDPSCGRGNILDVAARRGFPTVGSDLFERVDPANGLSPRAKGHHFFTADFLRLQRPPRVAGRRLLLINNSPYSYVEGIAEAFIRKALDLPIWRACFVVPIAFLGSDGRWAFFQREFKPSHIAILTERPSMPPGSTVTPYTTFKGGKGDYVWIIYTAGNGHRWRTETIWLRPSSKPNPGPIGGPR